MASKENRGYLKNLLLTPDRNNKYSDVMDFMFNPGEIDQQMSANYDDFSPVGFSGEFQNFRNTVGPNLTFELYFNSLMHMRETRVTLDQASERIEMSRRFLEALLLPAESPSGIQTGDNAPCILCLPGILTLRVKLQDLKIKFERQDEAKRLMEVRADVDFKEAPLSKTTMREHLDIGMNRTWGR